MDDLRAPFNAGFTGVAGVAGVTGVTGVAGVAGVAVATGGAIVVVSSAGGIGGAANVVVGVSDLTGVGSGFDVETEGATGSAMGWAGWGIGCK